MNGLKFLKENLSQTYLVGLVPGLCVCLPDPIAVMMSEGKIHLLLFPKVGKDL